MDVNYRNVVSINMYITPLLLLKHEMYLNKTLEMSVHSLARAKIIGIFIIQLLVSSFKFGHCVLLQMTDSVFTNADVFFFSITINMSLCKHSRDFLDC